MKKNILLFFVLLLAIAANAQLTVKSTCPEFDVDIIDGKVNGLKANATILDVKGKFPCFTTAEDESNTAKCGGGVFFKDKDLNFYTGRDYVEIGPKFKGKLSIPLFGTKRNSLFTKLGNPIMKDSNWDAYQTNYGLLILYYDTAGKVKLVRFSTQGVSTLNICE